MRGDTGDGAPPGADAASERQGELRLHNLLQDLAGLAAMLGEQLAAGAWLDSYLLAAGLNQIAEDYIHRDFFSLSLAAERLARLPAPIGPLIARATLGLKALELEARILRPGDRRARAWQTALPALLEALAQRVMLGGSGAAGGLDPEGGSSSGTPLDSGARAIAEVSSLPTAMQRSVARLPSAFRNFDLEPADCATVARVLSERWPDRGRAMLVVGVRSSGSYLAPLYTVALRNAGYRDVQFMTARPGSSLVPTERDRVREHARSGGLVLVADDPPSSGKAIASVAGQLERAGVQRASLVLLLLLVDDVPPRLRRYENVCLPREEWAIQEKLSPSAVENTLTDLLCGRTVRAPDAQVGTQVTVGRVQSVEPLTLPPFHDPMAAIPGRQHVRALFAVQAVDIRTGRHVRLQAYVKGVGLGYFGRHSLAVAGPLRSFIPDVFGLRDGLLYRAWLPVSWRLKASEIKPEFAGTVVSYVVERQCALAVPEDVSERLRGRQPLWERAGDLLGVPFGTVRLVIRPLLQGAARHLMDVSSPSVIDASMALSQWFACRAERGVAYRKVNFDERAFFNLDRVSYDPVFDLAGAAAAAELSEGEAAALFSEHVRRGYEKRSRRRISDEGWLLYQLQWLKLHELGLMELLPRVESRLGEGLLQEREAARRAMSRVHQRYFEGRFFAGLEPPVTGRCCAVDIDGVLETQPFGYAAVRGAGARTLHALMCHGYRPIVVTGRSLPEVRERCAAYHLAGGVAEYGAAMYNHISDQATILLSEADRDRLDSLRQALRGMDGVHIDPTYRLAVRAFRYDAEWRRRGLTAATCEEALARCGLQGIVQPVSGMAQTDFMVPSVDKASGLRALLQDLALADNGTDLTLAIAVGDSASDVEMLRMAQLAYAPANADAAVRDAGIARMRLPYDRGLAEAAARLLGHAPGGCSRCRPPELPADARLLAAILAAGGMGRAERCVQAVRVAWIMGRAAGTLHIRRQRRFALGSSRLGLGRQNDDGTGG